MHLFSRTTLFGIGIVAVIIGGIYAFSSSAKSTKNTTVARWLLSHQPVGVFARASGVFETALTKETDGRVSLSTVLPADVGYAAGNVPHADVLRLLSSGSVELASAFTVPLSEKAPDLGIFNLPFLFDTYDHALAALNSAGSDSILSEIGSGGDVRALAFTMSGGFRIIATKNKAIRTPADLKGLRIATSAGSLAEAMLRSFGAIPVPINLEGGSQIDPAQIDGVETTYSRLSTILGTHTEYTTYINETNHSLFLTTILVRTAFFNALSLADQAVLATSARAAADVERQDSIALADSTRAEMKKQGSVIVTLTPAERAAFKKAASSVYNDFIPKFSPQIVSQIVTQATAH